MDNPDNTKQIKEHILSGYEDAAEGISKIQNIDLTSSDSARMAELLLNPYEPSETLKKAAIRYQDLKQ